MTSFIHDPKNVSSVLPVPGDTFYRDFLEILKHLLQNFQKISIKYVLDTTRIMMFKSSNIHYGVTRLERGFNKIMNIKINWNKIL